MEDRIIIVNRWQTPDGKVLESKWRHDYVIHTDKITETTYSVDGGKDYVRLGGGNDMVDLCIYSDDDFEVVRKELLRGGRGKNGTEELKYVALCDMSDDWILSAIRYNARYGDSREVDRLYSKELEYRKERGIKIED